MLSHTAPAAGYNQDIHFLSESGFSFATTTSPASPILREFYEAYDRAFTLPNEKEALAGFAECLGLNHGDAYATLAARFGGFREYVAVIKAPQTGETIGGMNFIAFSLARLRTAQSPFLSVNLNYVLMNAQARNRGYFRAVMSDFPEAACALFARSNAPDALQTQTDAASTGRRVYVFIEQNDPVRMSREDYLRDTEASGLDQISRIGIWGRLGAKIVDFPYVQPPLSAKQGPDHNLIYAVLGVEGSTLEASILKAHLERFFGISVLKGRDPMSEPAAAAQLAALDRLCRDNTDVRLLSTGSAVSVKAALQAVGPGSGLSLRDALRNHPASGK